MIWIRKMAMKFIWTRIHFVTQFFTTGCCMSLRNLVGLPLNMFQTTQPWTELKYFCLQATSYLVIIRNDLPKKLAVIN